MQTNITELYGETVLGGAQGGKLLLGKLHEFAATTKVVTPTTWFLDLTGVVVVSASFAREAFVTIQAVLLAQRSLLLPVIANATQDVRDDLHLAFKEAGKAIVACSTDHAGQIGGISLLGALESFAEATFTMVYQRGETDAKELLTAQADANQIGHTAWNNRLAALAALGLLVEIPQGRSKRYRAAV